MTTVRSAKSKGARLQNHVRDGLREAFPELEPGDITSCPMGSTGEDIRLSPLAKKVIGLEFECKARKTGFTPVYAALAQADREEALTPIAVIRQDRKKALVVLSLDDFLNMIKEGKPND